MHVEATTAGALAADADTIVIGAFEGEPIGTDFGQGELSRLLESGEAKTTFKHLAVAHAPDGRRAIVVGLGSRAQLDPERARAAAAVVYRRARELATRTLCWEVPAPELVSALVEGTMLRAYRFTRYKPSDEPGPGVQRLLLSSAADVSGATERAFVLTRAQNRARDLANTPANDLTPAALADYAVALAGQHPGLHATVLDEDEIRALGMGAFAAVAQGSVQGARLIKLEYDGVPAGGRGRVALVGKAITFDSGGLSLKPPASMPEMKFDMSGGAAVIEAMAALEELGAPVRVLGVVGASENLPSGSAVKPGDVVRTLKGVTVEVNNTDAEGRLVLSDCLAYARREGCGVLLDIATLTGGIVVALGKTYAGMMSDDDGLAGVVARCGERTGELVWRMPLHREYADMIKGRYAQIVNTTERREATALTAAEFLHRFVGDEPWAHLDIAGTAYDMRRDYFEGKGATGFGVRLLAEVAMAWSDAGGARAG